MSRLPQPGGDSGNWGDILNDFLMQSHKADGVLKDDSVGSSQLQPNAVTANALAPGSVTTGALASDAVTAAILADGSVGTAQLADGSVTKPKLESSVQASLDKADSALQSAPVTSVNTKTGAVSLDKTDIGLGNVDNTSDANKPVSSATQLALDLKLDSTTAASTYAPINNPTLTGTLTTPALKVTGGTLAAGKLLTSDASGNATWQPAPAAPVTSVNTKTGAVTLDKTDVGLGNVDNTSDATKNSATATLTNKTISGASNTITNVSLTTGVAGVLPIASGGTGSSTQNFVDLTNAQTIGGTKTFTGNVMTGNNLTVGTTANQVITLNSNSPSHGIELGRTDGTTTTPYIDFHSGTTAVDFDVRLLASGGNGTAGNGTLQVSATTLLLGATALVVGSTSTVGYPLIASNTTGRVGFGQLPLATAVSGVLPVANGGTGSSTQNFVDLTTAQTITGNKTLSGTTYIPDITSLQTTYSTNSSISMVTDSATTNPFMLPISNIWFDLFAYNNRATPTYATSTDGTTYTTGTLSSGVFVGGANLAASADRLSLAAATYHRWVWASSFGWSTGNAAAWLYLGLPYASATSPQFSLVFESSSDGTTWTSRATVNTGARQQVGFWVRIPNWNGDTQIRLTINNSGTQPLAVSRIALFSMRPDMVNAGADQPIPSNARRQLALGSATLPATAMVRIGDDTTANTGGMQFGSDTYLYRSAATTLTTNAGLNTGGDLGIGGAFYPGAITRTTTVSIGIHDKLLNYANASSGAITLTLPSTSSPGVMFTIKKIDSSSNAVTVAGTIDGATNYTLSSQNQSITVVSTATSGSWYTVGTNGANLAAATGVLPIANGGTGSSTQNFVDLTAAQTVAGAKTFSGKLALGSTTQPATGLIRVGDDTTANTGGLQFGSDTYLYRSQGNGLATAGAFMVNGATRLVGATKLTGQVYTSNTTLDWTKPLNAIVDATSGNITISLTSTTEIGLTFTIKKIDASANTVTISGTIDGATNYTLTSRYSWVTVISTSTSGVWYITGKG